MIRSRRPLATLAVLVVAGLATGCATFTDSGLAARSADDELSHDDIEAVVDDFADGVDAAGGTGAFARQVLAFWLQTQLFESAVADSGGEVTDADRDEARAGIEAGDPVFADYSSTTQEILVDNSAAFEVFQRQFAPSDADLRAIYEAGPEAGIACTRHILVEAAEEADDAAARLDDGEAFGDVAAEVSLDPGSVVQGGFLGCIPTEQFAAQLVPEYVDATFAAEIGVPTDPVESQFGFHIIEVLSYDEVDPAQIEAVAAGASSGEQDAALATAADTLDAYVDPRYGQFTGDLDQLVVPLG